MEWFEYKGKALYIKQYSKTMTATLSILNNRCTTMLNIAANAVIRIKKKDFFLLALLFIIFAPFFFWVSPLQH